MDMQQVAQAMVAAGKGILAIDESHGTCEKRFVPLGIEFNEENRRQYRQLLITAPGIEEAVSGMILFDETIRQKTDDGTPFPQAMQNKGMIVGIKVDAGAKDLALHPGEKVTEGLDGLRERLAEYKELGAQFAKWRAVITIGDDIPSTGCVVANCHALARYAGLCQEAGIVPMVEPEILIDGNHSIEECEEISAAVWQVLFEEMDVQGVDLSAAILKTSMVISGKDNERQADVSEVAERTVKTLVNNVPNTIAGVVFLSGGQTAQQSTDHLNAMHQSHAAELPWPLSFSYGRGIQQPALEQWAGDSSSDNVKKAQDILVHRAKMNGLAAEGKYERSMDGV